MLGFIEFTDADKVILTNEQNEFLEHSKMLAEQGLSEFCAEDLNYIPYNKEEALS